MSTSVLLLVTVDFQSWVVEVSSFSSSKNLPPLFKSLLCLPSPICSLDASFRWSGVGLWSPPASAGFGHGARASSSPSSITIFHIQTMQLPHHGGGVRVQGDLGLGGAVSLHLGGQVIPQVPNLVLQLAFSRSDPARRFFSPSSGSEKTEVAFFRLNINSVFSSLGGLCGVYPGAAGSTFFWGCSACVSGSPRSSP